MVAGRHVWCIAVRKRTPSPVPPWPSTRELVDVPGVSIDLFFCRIVCEKRCRWNASPKQCARPRSSEWNIQWCRTDDQWPLAPQLLMLLLLSDDRQLCFPLVLLTTAEAQSLRLCCSLSASGCVVVLATTFHCLTPPKVGRLWFPGLQGYRCLWHVSTDQVVWVPGCSRLGFPRKPRGVFCSTASRGHQWNQSRMRRSDPGVWERLWWSPSVERQSVQPSTPFAEWSGSASEAPVCPWPSPTVIDRLPPGTLRSSRLIVRHHRIHGTSCFWFLVLTQPVIFGTRSCGGWSFSTRFPPPFGVHPEEDRPTWLRNLLPHALKQHLPPDQPWYEDAQRIECLWDRWQELALRGGTRNIRHAHSQLVGFSTPDHT